VTLSNTIRVVEIDGQPWFVASDVCRILGYDIARRGVTSFISAVRGDERRMITKDNTPELFWGKRGQPQKIALSESGLYKLIMRSDKPQAHKFQDWVAREVLPDFSNPDIAARA
jgi:prophage antirepressor-like protein